MVTEKNNREAIRGTTAGAELYLSYILVRAQQLLLEDIERRLNRTGFQLKGEQKMWFKNFHRQLRGAIIDLGKFDDDIANAYERDPQNFDYFNRTANEIVKVALRLIIANESHEGCIEALNRELKMKFSYGIPEDDIEHFTMR